jgi:hypothetical protein
VLDEIAPFISTPASVTSCNCLVKILSLILKLVILRYFPFSKKHNCLFIPKDLLISKFLEIFYPIHIFFKTFLKSIVFPKESLIT